MTTGLSELISRSLSKSNLLAELKEIWPEVKNVTFRTDGLLDHAIKSLNQAVRDLDDLIDDLCGAFNEVIGVYFACKQECSYMSAQEEAIKWPFGSDKS